MIGLEVRIDPFFLTLDMKHTRAVLRAAGNEVASVARALIRRSSGGGRFYNYKGHRGARYRASAPGQPPVSVSGALAKSIKVRLFRSGEGVAVRDAEFYAKFLELGAKGGGGYARGDNILLAGERHWRTGRVLRLQNRMKSTAVSQSRTLAPRPFLSVALDAKRASIEARIGEAITGGIKFSKEPPPWSLLK
jgi:hypothetical protein